MAGLMRPAGHVSEAPGKYGKIKSQWLSLAMILSRSAIKFKISLNNIWILCVTNVACQTTQSLNVQLVYKTLAQCFVMVR
jgi:hypothetical protein